MKATEPSEIKVALKLKKKWKRISVVDFWRLNNGFDRITKNKIRISE